MAMNTIEIEEALKEAGWKYDCDHDAWSNGGFTSISFEKAVVYAIRFGKGEIPAPGDKVQVVEGPFLNFPGVVEKTDLKLGIVRVDVDIYGRKTLCSLDIRQIKVI